MKFDENPLNRWKKLFLFLCACVSGVLFAMVYRRYEESGDDTLTHVPYYGGLRETGYEAWLREQQQEQHWLPEEKISFSTTEGIMEHDFLKSHVTVLCIVLSKTKARALAINNTWARHCNDVLFFGSYVDSSIPVREVRGVMSIKGFCNVALYIHTHSKNYHWFLVTDDDTFGLVHNLRYYVAPLNSSHPYYLGHAARVYSRFYNEGEAGITLSKGAMEHLLRIAVAKKCSTLVSPSTFYDEGIGVLLHRTGVTPLDTRDPSGKARFISFSPEQMLIPGSISIFSSYWRRSVFLSSEGGGCCSDNAITFHGISPSQMFLMEYLLHHLRPFLNSNLGIGNHPPPLSKKSESNSMIAEERKGVPFIKPLHRAAKEAKKRQKNHTKESVFSSLWKEFFKN